jgi:hypothetical protein
MPADNFSDASSEEESWEERSWRVQVERLSYRYTYDRRKQPYKKFAPQIPFYPHLAASKSLVKVGGGLHVRLPDTVVFGLAPDPGSDGALP